jgi:hypothetical protein
VHETDDRRKFPIPPRNSLFGAEDYLFDAEQGIVRSALELRHKWTRNLVESAEMAGDFQNFPVIFPWDAPLW